MFGYPNKNPLLHIFAIGVLLNHHHHCVLYSLPFKEIMEHVPWCYTGIRVCICVIFRRFVRQSIQLFGWLWMVGFSKILIRRFSFSFLLDTSKSQRRTNRNGESLAFFPPLSPPFNNDWNSWMKTISRSWEAGMGFILESVSVYWRWNRKLQLTDTS